MLTRFSRWLAAVLLPEVVQKCAAGPTVAGSTYGVGLPPLTFRVSPTTKLDSADARNT
jgi:hypothetical protein